MRLRSWGAVIVGAAIGGGLDGLTAWLGAPFALGAVNGSLLVAVGALGPAVVGAIVGPLIPWGRLPRAPAPAIVAGAAALALLGAWVLALLGPAPPIGAPDPAGLARGIAAGLLALAAALLWRGDAVSWALGAIPAVLAVLTLTPLDLGATPGEGRTILLVTIDGLRADEVPEDGALAALGRSGVRFQRAVTPVPRSGPAHAALHTGRGPWDDGIVQDAIAVPDTPLLAERLSAAGWRTAAFVSSDLVTGGLGFRRGFDTYDDELGFVRGLDRVALGRLAALTGPLGPPSRTAPFTLEPALAWLAAESGPAFVWVHLQDPVGPYVPPDPWDKRFYGGSDPRDPGVRSLAAALPLSPEHGGSLDGITDRDWVIAQHRGEVAYVDHELQPLLDAVGEEAIVVVVGTHGEALGEGGRWFLHGEARPAEVVVPLILRAPGLPAGGAVPWPVELTDVAPTVLDLAGLPVPRSMTGRSLAESAREGLPLRSVARSVAVREEAGFPMALVLGPRGGALALGDGPPLRLEDGSPMPADHPLGGPAAELVRTLEPTGEIRLGPGGPDHVRRLGGLPPR